MKHTKRYILREQYESKYGTQDYYTSVFRSTFEEIIIKAMDEYAKQESAELLEVLQHIISCNGVGYKDANKFVKDLQPLISEAQNAIKKATQNH